MGENRASVRHSDGCRVPGLDPLRPAHSPSGCGIYRPCDVFLCFRHQGRAGASPIMFGCGAVGACDSVHTSPNGASERCLSLARGLERFARMDSVDNTILRIRAGFSQVYLCVDAELWRLSICVLEPDMASGKSCSINNDIYDQYGERWYTADDDPVALLRAEARARNRWIISEMTKRFSDRGVQILDVGCGAGFLANELALNGYRVTGLDTSEPTLKVASRHDSTGTVDYRSGDACKMEFGSGTFNVVCAMDFLEHIENPKQVVREAARVLKSGGLFFFYTFNRNFLTWLVVIKGVEWFVRNTPRNMHCLRFFIKPAELKHMCRENGLRVVLCRGLAPKVWNRSFWKMLVTGKVDDRFAFNFKRHTIMGYIGLAIRDLDA
jgi:2-polyprenyl-6-hydroxyphenyl methylase / 3-demethylubiquinone-9 3-methyltransferase